MTSKTWIELSSNSKPVGEVADSPSAQFPWKWQRNSRTPLCLSLSIFSAFFRPPFPSFCLVGTRAMRRDATRTRSNGTMYIHSACPASVPPFLSFGRRVFICSITMCCFVREKKPASERCPGPPFPGGNRAVYVFLATKTVVIETTEHVKPAV